MLAAVPPMGKEERRRAFAEAAAAADESRRREQFRYWPQEGFAPMFPPGLLMLPDAPDWHAPPPQGPPGFFPQALCMPQHK